MRLIARDEVIEVYRDGDGMDETGALIRAGIGVLF